jgi:hypothetical protein
VCVSICEALSSAAHQSACITRNSPNSITRLKSLLNSSTRSQWPTRLSGPSFRPPLTVWLMRHLSGALNHRSAHNRPSRKRRSTRSSSLPVRFAEKGVASMPPSSAPLGSSPARVSRRIAALLVVVSVGGWVGITWGAAVNLLPRLIPREILPGSKRYLIAHPPMISIGIQPT